MQLLDRRIIKGRGMKGNTIVKKEVQTTNFHLNSWNYRTIISWLRGNHRVIKFGYLTLHLLYCEKDALPYLVSNQVKFLH